MNWPWWLTPLITVVTAVTLIGLERLRPYDPQQRFFRDGFFVDLFWYTLVQSLLLGVVIQQLIRLIDAGSGISRLHLVSDWPVLAQLAFFFVVHDFYIYWFHRWQHSNQYLWRLHEAHHATNEVDWLSGSRSHPLEILVNQTIEYAPIVLLGAHPDVALMKGAVDAVWGMYIHCNVDVRSGLIQRVINGPEMHRWHHSGDVTDAGYNFSTKLAIWDWMFGTAHLPAQKPPCYGLSGGAPFPGGYFGQVAYLFRPFRRS